MSTLLVIDDDQAILDVFRRLFHGPDMTVVTAASAKEGLGGGRQHPTRTW